MPFFSQQVKDQSLFPALKCYISLHILSQSNYLKIQGRLSNIGYAQRRTQFPERTISSIVILSSAFSFIVFRNLLFMNLHKNRLLSLCDWSSSLAPFSQPIRCKTNTNLNLVTCVFPLFGQFACFCLEHSLAPLCDSFFDSDWQFFLLWFLIYDTQLKSAHHQVGDYYSDIKTNSEEYPTKNAWFSQEN